MRLPCAYLLLCISVLNLSTHAAEPTPLPPGAVGVVNGQPLARSLLDELARARSGGGAGTAETPDRKRLLDDLINMELLSQRARHTGVAARPQTRAELELARKTLLGQRLLQQMSAEMQIDDATLQARYRELPADAQIDASHILLSDEAAARALIAQLQAGASFAALARKHSTDTETAPKGGSLGAIKASELTPAFAAAAQALKPGTYTREPVRTEFGWHVIRLGAVRKLAKPSFETMRAGLKTQIAGERLQAQLTQWRKEAKLTVLQAP